MAFLTLNGFTVSILDGSAELSEEEIGSSSRAFSGHLVQSTRARARVLSAQTPILSATDAKALVGLLKGEGHFWQFTDEYSSKALGPASGSYTLTLGNINVASGSTVTFDTNVGSDWSLMVRYNAAAATYTLDSTGVKYKNAVTTTDTVSNIADVSSGDLQLKGYLGTQAYAYAAVVPYVFTAAMHVAFSGSPSPFQSELPVLAASGNVFGAGSTPVYMRLQYESLSLEPVQYMASGSITTGFEVSFTLEEVL